MRRPLAKLAGGAGFRSLLSWALLETFNGISSTARVVGDAWPDAPAFVEARQPLLAAQVAGARVCPGEWAQYTEAFEFVRRDLAAAADPAKRGRSEASDLLAYENARGEKAGFHSLRHHFVTELVKAGIMPKDAKELARHQTITLTMDRYATSVSRARPRPSGGSRPPRPEQHRAQYPTPMGAET